MFGSPIMAHHDGLSVVMQTCPFEEALLTGQFSGPSQSRENESDPSVSLGGKNPEGVATGCAIIDVEGR